MSILGVVGRKSRRVRFAIFVMYFLLVTGGITMVYPFLIMINGALSNAHDYEKYSIYPKWIFDSKERYLKYLNEKYKMYPEKFEIFASTYDLPSSITKFRDLTFASDEVINKAFPEFEDYENKKAQWNSIYDDYLDFMAQYDSKNVMPLFFRYSWTDYQKFLQRKYENLYLKQNNLKRDDISSRKLYQAAVDLMNEMDQRGKYDRFERVEFSEYINFSYHLHGWFLDLSKNNVRSYLEFLEERLKNPDKDAFLNCGTCLPVTGKRLWNRYLLNKGYVLDELNTEWGTDYESFYRIPFFTTELPENPSLRAEFKEFLLAAYPFRLMEIKPGRKDDYFAFLKERVGDIKRYNILCETSYGSYDEMEFPNFAPENKLERLHWLEFAKTLALDDFHIHSAERDYQNFLKKKYAGIEKVNETYGKNYPSFASIAIPFRQIDLIHFKKNESKILRKFFTFNFSEAFSYITTRGRALFNTFVLVSLTILGTLTVNPLAAYALSRYRMRATHKILIFLLATMAFPPAVVMIPNFLLLRDLHLLNTFGALVLPGLANGFSIFLLKGFFDSLPIELYEAASIDGASEWTMFWRITMPLCKPILAVLALNAFVASYGGFMWAFLVCQNEKMWTLMVWIYNFQVKYMSDYQMPFLVMAALLIASIPTLIVFLTAQKVILRGIIIPTMK